MTMKITVHPKTIKLKICTTLNFEYVMIDVTVLADKPTNKES